jgi:DNA-binding NarL/FixJ family response regulator
MPGSARQPRNLLGLTERQMQVVRLAARNWTYAEIAADLGSTKQGIATEASRVHQRLGFEGANCGVATGYVVGVFDAGRPKVARALCPAYASEDVDVAAL